MRDYPTFGHFLAESMYDLTARADDDRRASFVTGLAVITMLIDAGLVTIEEAAQRIEMVHRSLPDDQKTEGLRLRILHATEWLRAHLRQPNRAWTPSVIDGGLSPEAPLPNPAD